MKALRIRINTPHIICYSHTLNLVIQKSLLLKNKKQLVKNKNMDHVEPESDIYSENEESRSEYLDELDSEDSMDEYEDSFQNKAGEEEEGESDLEEKFSSDVDDTSKY